MDSDVKPAPKFAIKTMHMDIEAARKGEKAKPTAHSLSEDSLTGKGTGTTPRVQIDRPTSWRAYTPAQEKESTASRSLTENRQKEYKPTPAPISQQPLKSIPSQAPETIFTSTPTGYTPKRPAGAAMMQATLAQTSILGGAAAPVQTAPTPASPVMSSQTPQGQAGLPQQASSSQPVMAAPAMPSALDTLLSKALSGQTQAVTSAPATSLAPSAPPSGESGQMGVRVPGSSAAVTGAEKAKPLFSDTYAAPQKKQSAEDIVSSVLTKKDISTKEKTTTEKKEAPTSREFKISSPTTSDKSISTAAQVQSVARKNLPSYLREMPKPPSPDGGAVQEIETEERVEQQKPIRKELEIKPRQEEKKTTQPEQKRVFQETKREAFGDATLPQIKKEPLQDTKKSAIKPEPPKEGDYFTIPKKKILPKILIIIGVIVVAGAIGFAVYTILFKKALTTPETTPPAITEEKPETEQPKTPTEEKPAEIIDTTPKEKMPALLRYDQQVEVSANKEQLKQTLAQVTELETLTGPLVLMQLIQNGSHLSVTEFFSAMNIPLPATIAEKTQSFNAVLHINGREKRLGVVLKISDAFVVDSALLRWQDEIIKGAPQEGPAIAPLFLNLPHSYDGTQPAFQEVVYNNTYIKYLNLPDSETSFDYALITDYKQNSYVVFATSQKQVSALVDGILTASR